MRMKVFTRIFQLKDKDRPDGWYTDLINELDFDLEAEQFAARRARTG